MRATTLVVGATGPTGRRVAARLAARDMPTRFEPPFDIERSATWAPALRGVEAVYVSYLPYVAAVVGAFCELAVATGVRRLVLLSCRGEDASALAEQAVRSAGAEWTIVRASWFAQLFSEGHLLGPVREGEVALPARPVGEPFVDADDIADVAVAALTGEGHAGRIYEATGPRLLTFAEAIEEVAEAAGRDIRYARVSLEQYTSWLAGQRAPAMLVSRLRYLFAEVLDGRNARLCGGVQRALGRQPRDFADFARDTAATGIWSPGVLAR